MWPPSVWGMDLAWRAVLTASTCRTGANAPGVKSLEPADRKPKEKETSLVARPAIPQLERHLRSTDSGDKPDEVGNLAAVSSRSVMR
jgi:hypothetical protein